MEGHQRREVNKGKTLRRKRDGEEGGKLYLGYIVKGRRWRGGGDSMRGTWGTPST